MAMYNTGNPVGSTQPKDLSDNAQVLDKLVVGTDPSVVDRLGNLRYSWAGMEYDFQNAQDGRQAQFEDFLTTSSLIFVGDYGAGLNFTNRSQYMIRDGVPYRIAYATTLPYTTTGNWATEQTNFTPVSSDDILRQDLSQPTGAGLVGESVYDGNLQSVMSAIPRYARLKGYPSGGADDLVGLQAWLDELSAAGGAHVIFDDAANIPISNALHVSSNMTLEWTEGAGFLTLTQSSTVGHVLAAYAGNTALPPVSNIKFINPKIDGGDNGWPTSAPYGENGIAGTRCSNVRVFGGTIKNCREGQLRHYGTGGNAVQFEAGVSDIIVSGLTARNCTNGLSTQGLENAAPPADLRTSTGVLYTGIKLYDCERILGIFQAFSPPSADVRVLSTVIDGVQAYRCGKGRTGTGSDTSLPTDMGAINLDRAANYSIRNVHIYNDGDYGAIDSVVRTIRSEAGDIEVTLYGSATNLVKHVVPNAGAGFAFSGLLRRNTYNITCYGVVTNPVNINRTTDTNGTLTDQVYNLRAVSMGSPFIVTDSGLSVGATNRALIFEFGTGKQVSGQMEQIRAAGNSFSAQLIANQGTHRFNTMAFSYGSGSDSILADGTLGLYAGGVQRLELTSGHTRILGLSTFADNAAAAALPVGAIYRTSAGALMVRF